MLFAIGIVIFTTGSLCCGLATGSLFLAIARGAQGVGGAIMFATSLALLAQTFQGRDRGVALGLFGAITGVAIAIGPVLGGAITTRPLVALDLLRQHPDRARRARSSRCCASTSRATRTPRGPTGPGSSPSAPRLAALVYGLIESQSDGWGSTTVIASLAASAVLLAAFLVVERIQAEPMLDLGAAARADVRRRAGGGLGDLGRASSRCSRT